MDKVARVLEAPGPGGHLGILGRWAQPVRRPNMSVRSILKMGDVRPLQQARPVEDFTAPWPRCWRICTTPWLSIMALALAAPQIGEPWQVVVFGSGAQSALSRCRAGAGHGVDQPHSDATGAAMEEDWEGCFVHSRPGGGACYRELRYQGFDAHGQPIDCTVSGFHPGGAA